MKSAAVIVLRSPLDCVGADVNAVRTLGGAINMGLSNMAESSRGMNYVKLSWLSAWYTREDFSSTESAELVNSESNHFFAATGGDGTRVRLPKSMATKLVSCFASLPQTSMCCPAPVR